MKKFLFKYLAIVLLFCLTKSYSQSLPISSYGVWDRGGQITNFADPNVDFVKGIEATASWEDIELIKGTFDFSSLQQELDKAYANNKLIRFSVEVGPDSPLWMYDIDTNPNNNPYPQVQQVTTSGGNDKPSWPIYPEYLSQTYQDYLGLFIKQFAIFLRSQPSEKFSKIAFVQVKTGCTGDEVPYKGNVDNPIYDISDPEWFDHRLMVFQKYKEFFNDDFDTIIGNKIVLSFNDIDPSDPNEVYAWNWITTQIDPAIGFGIKGGAFNRGHHLSGEQSYKESLYKYLVNPKLPIKTFSASEMDGTTQDTYFQICEDMSYYWAALGGINVGLSTNNLNAVAMDYAINNPSGRETFRMFTRYAQQVYPAAATTAFSVFHEGLNAADKVKFPEAYYGNATMDNQARYLKICNEPKYYNRGARMDDVFSATKGQVYQRASQTGLNDAGWEIAEGNIERFMTQIDPDNTSIGLFRVRGAITSTSSKYDRFARSFENATGKNTMYFKLDSQLPASNKILKFTIIWLDKTAGATWAFRYRNSSGLQTIPFTGTGTNEWKTETFTLTNAIMNQGGTNGSDFMLVNTDTTDDIFNSIEMNILDSITYQSIFDNSGTWVAPESVTSVSVECWGGGGGGGGAASSGIAGGGAGGSYVKNSNLTVVPLTTYTLTVGAGSAASGTGGVDGNIGENSTFGLTNPIIIANGGASGKGASSSSLGLGGVNSTGGSGGDTVTPGTNGSNAVASISGAGGKGGGLSGGAGGASKTSLGAGNAGTSPGGGGSGAYGPVSGSRAGGAGGAGQIKITYTVGLPNAPTIGTATVSGFSGQALIPFTAPSFNGNSTITSYTATSSPGGLTATINQSGSGVITVNGLTNGIVYTFTVKATNYVGQSAASGVSNSVTPMVAIVSNGSGGGAWSTAATWIGGIAPGTNDNAIILGLDALSVDITGAICNNLIIDATGSLTINTDKYLTVKNTLVNNGSLTVENNANLIQTAVTNTNSGFGTSTAKRNSNALLRLDYTLWSSPVSGSQTLAQFSPLTSQSPTRFYTYNVTTNLYSSINPIATTFGQGKGYLIRMPNDVNTVSPSAYAGVFTGTLTNGPIAVPVTTGFNLVGNPYASNISFSTLRSENSSLIGTTAYFWRKTNGAGGSAYCTYNSSGSTYISNGAPGAAGAGLFDGIIQSGQGFFVNATATGTLNFANTQRTSTTTNQAFFKTKQVATADKLWLNATNAIGDFSQMAVTYSAGASTGVDDFDSKYINDSGYALTSSINGEEYTIQGRPVFDATDVVSLNFKTIIAGAYTIALANTEGVFTNGQAIYLVDGKTGTETDLKVGSYTFSALAGVDNSRFTLKFQKTLKVDATYFNENSVRVYQNKGTLYVVSDSSVIKKIEVYDIQGRVIAQQKAVESNYRYYP